MQVDRKVDAEERVVTLTVSGEIGDPDLLELALGVENDPEVKPEFSLLVDLRDADGLNVTGAGALAHPRYPQGLAAAFVAGPRGGQKDVVMGLVRDVGLEAVDAGELRAARLLEPLGMLMMLLEETGAKGCDVAFVLGSRTRRQAEPCAVFDMEAREAG